MVDIKNNAKDRMGHITGINFISGDADKNNSSNQKANGCEFVNVSVRRKNRSNASLGINVCGIPYDNLGRMISQVETTNSFGALGTQCLQVSLLGAD